MDMHQICTGPFQPTFESLRNFECPAWFRDAKLGIWSHWGAQSVPMYGDWYARNMYIEGSAQYRYHVRHFGHPSEFGYKDLVQRWKAEHFNPEELMNLYVAAGAKYFVAQAMHHDYFFNYDSRVHRWNSVQMGPRKNIVGLWQQAAKNHGLPFGLTEHLGNSFAWNAVNKGADREGPYAGIPYDGSDPQYEDLYLPNREHYRQGGAWDVWYSQNAWWHQRWFDIMKDLIDQHQPDLLYSDGALPFGEKPGDSHQAGLHIVAHLYNRSAARNDGVNHAVYTQKDRNRDVYSIGILDIERSQEPDINMEPWQTDTCPGDWFYDVRSVYKKPAHIIEILVDIVSKNGNLLLNVPQKPDGTIDAECRFLLQELAGWNKVCREGIFGTRPFQVFGEGPSSVIIDGFKEDRVTWSSSDFRFTQKGRTVYAFQMKWPENNTAVIESLAGAGRIKAVRLLGACEVAFEQPFGTLVVQLPDSKPTAYVNCLAIELDV